MRAHCDDLGHLSTVSSPARVVSLVPSITEALAATCPDRLVGATDWCSHPADLDVRRVRGTKNPDHAAITALMPDLVVANREENRRIDVERLRAAGVPVWVTVVESVDGAIDSLRRLCTDALDLPEPEWLTEAAQVWGRPPALAPRSVVVPIWRNPWMFVGSGTFTGDLLVRLGLHHVLADAAGRYPRMDLDQPEIARAGLVLLPDEPYRFAADDGPEAFPHGRTVLVSGRDLTWYGPSMVTARGALESRIEDLPTAGGSGT
jgi:ABC-type Fe3+-hydroxamate transport system substrate-binding protein